MSPSVAAAILALGVAMLGRSGMLALRWRSRRRPSGWDGPAAAMVLGVAFVLVGISELLGTDRDAAAELPALTAVGVLLLGVGFVVVGVLSWQGRVARAVPQWQGAVTIVLVGMVIVVLGGAELVRQALGRSEDWWLMAVAKPVAGVCGVAAIAYALLNNARWFPQRLRPPHHRRPPRPKTAAGADR